MYAIIPLSKGLYFQKQMAVRPPDAICVRGFLLSRVRCDKVCHYCAFLCQAQQGPTHLLQAA